MKSLLYNLAGSTAWHTGSGKRIAQDSIGMLMLHGVHNRGMEASTKAPRNSMPLEAFQRGVKALLSRYQIIDLDTAIAMLSGDRKWEARCLVLTFDDSLHCLLPTAATWLAEIGLNATFYLSTEVIDSQRPYWWKRLERAVAMAKPGEEVEVAVNDTTILIDPALGLQSLAALKKALKLVSSVEIEKVVSTVEEQLQNPDAAKNEDPYARVLNWAEVRELASLGMTIGSHSVTHPNLTLLSPDEVRIELVESRERIQSQAEVSCDHFCYPYGAHSPAVCAATREAGYQSAVTTVTPGWNRDGADPFILQRFSMPKDSGRATAMMAGVQSLRRSLNL